MLLVIKGLKDIFSNYNIMENTNETKAEEIKAENFVDVFEKIPDNAMVVKLKFNNIADDEHSNIATGKFFVEECLKAKIMYSSAGLHLNGKNKVPHIHYHFITHPFKKPSNISVYKKRWMEREGWETTDFNASIQIDNLDKSQPKYHTLCYPLKEGLEPIIEKQQMLRFKIFFDSSREKERMSRSMIDFLKNVGNEIYQTQLAANDRRDKCEERKQNKLNDLFKLCDENKEHFSNYREMVYWLDDNFIAKLELNELPDSRNYKLNCEKVAVKLGLLKFSGLIL